jgi:hypothetical protein
MITRKTMKLSHCYSILQKEITCQIIKKEKKATKTSRNPTKKNYFTNRIILKKTFSNSSVSPIYIPLPYSLYCIPTK